METKYTQKQQENYEKFSLLSPEFDLENKVGIVRNHQGTQVGKIFPSKDLFTLTDMMGNVLYEHEDLDALIKAMYKNRSIKVAMVKSAEVKRRLDFAELAKAKTKQKEKSKTKSRTQ